MIKSFGVHFSFLLIGHTGEDWSVQEKLLKKSYPYSLTFSIQFQSLKKRDSCFCIDEHHFCSMCNKKIKLGSQKLKVKKLFDCPPLHANT